jgi:hypothetical protein
MVATRSWWCECGKQINEGEQFEIIDGCFYCYKCIEENKYAGTRSCKEPSESAA